jgi:hypothetical protein
VKESTNQPAATAQCEMQQLQQTNEQKKGDCYKENKDTYVTVWLTKQGNQKGCI